MPMRLPRLVAALAGAALLGGCVGLHADESIRPGLAVNAPESQPIVILPEGPRAGATPEDVIRGFLRAGGVSGDAIAGAKSYLTPGQSAKWNPDAATVVVEEGSGVDITDRGAGRYTLRATPVGTLDTDGRYTPVAGGADKVAIDIVLSKVAGQWRISNLPGDFGRWLSPGAFGGLMRQVSTHYLSADGADLVPDVRWVIADRMATRTVRLQLGAVPAYLGTAVRSELAGGVHLLVDSVPVIDGVATVNLAATAIPNDSVARRNIWTQLVATVTQAPTVIAVDVTVEGTRLTAPGIDAPVADIDELGIEDPGAPTGILPLVRVGDGLYPLDPSRLEHVEPEEVTQNPSPYPVIAANFRDLALSFAGQEVAAVDQGELARFRTGETATVPNFGTELTGPAYDRTGVLWVAGRPLRAPEDGALWAVNATVSPAADPDAQAVRVPAPWLAGRLPVSLAISVDGTRLAIISTDRRGRDPRLDVAGIVRAADGLPTALASTPLRLGPRFTTLRDLVWIGETTLAVVGAEDRGPLRPFLITLGQQVTPLPALKGATHISTLGGERRLVIRSGSRMYVRAGARWLPVVGSDLVVPAR